MTRTIAAGTPIALVVALAAGCFSPEPPRGLPCTDDHRCPDGQTCDLVTNVCTGPTTDEVWRDDTAADFDRPGASFGGTSVEEPGAIAPTPYLTGGLRITAAVGARFSDESTATWEALTGATPSGRGMLRYVGFDVGGDRLLGVGVTATEDVTAWIEGEIWFDAGTWQLRLEAGGVGFVDVAVDGAFTRVASATDAADGEGTIVIPADGWYPVRGAVADVDEWFYYYLTAGGPEAGTSPGWIEPERLRARVDDLHGVVLDGFDDPYALFPTASAIFQGSLASAVVDDDLSLGDGDWSVRYAGQLRIDVGGSYALAIDSYAGHRLWVDGVRVIDDLGYDEAQNTTDPLTLDAGWHDVVIEQMWGSPEPPRMALTVASGPELVGQGFPLERTRPVVGRGVRWVANSCWYEEVPDNGAASCSAWIGLPEGATALDADLGWEVNHPVLSSLQVTLTSPDETTIALAQPGDLSGAGGAGDRVHIDVASGSEAAGWWELGMTDTVTDMQMGYIDALSVTTTYRGGTAPFASVATFTSAVRDLGDVTSFGEVAWSVRQGSTVDAVVRLRTGADAAACEGAAWTEVAPGLVPSTIAPRRFAQYQVELHGNGDVPTALDWIELRYKRAE